MNALELKGGLYDLIAGVNDKELLARIYTVISQLINQSEGQADFMDELPSEVQAELRLAYKESFDEENLVDENVAMEEIQYPVGGGSSPPSEYEALISKSQRQIENGEYVTMEELEEESKTWL